MLKAISLFQVKLKNVEGCSTPLVVSYKHQSSRANSLYLSAVAGSQTPVSCPTISTSALWFTSHSCSSLLGFCLQSLTTTNTIPLFSSEDERFIGNDILFNSSCLINVGTFFMFINLKILNIFVTNSLRYSSYILLRNILNRLLAKTKRYIQAFELNSINISFKNKNPLRIIQMFKT